MGIVTPTACAGGDVTSMLDGSPNVSAPTPASSSSEPSTEPAVDSDDIEAVLARNDAIIAQAEAEVEALRQRTSAEDLATFEAWYAAHPELDVLAERRALREAPLSSEERDQVMLALEGRGVDLDQVSFIGRAVIHGDVSFSADEWLPAAGANADVDKALLVSSIQNSTVAGYTSAPAVFVRDSGGQIQFRRPETNRTYYIVVPDAAPSWLFDALTQAVNDFVAMPGDCSLSMAVVRNAYYTSTLDLLARALSSKITVAYDSTACDDQNPNPDADGCAVFPRYETMALSPTSSQSRLRLGNYLGFEPHLVQSSARSVALHELTHIFGYAHPAEADFDDLIIQTTERVPTTGLRVAPSIMVPTNDAYLLYSNAPSSEDKYAQQILYGGQCAYSDSWRNLGASCANADEEKCLRHGASCEKDLAGTSVCRWVNLTDQASCGRYSPGAWQTSGVVIHPERTGACIKPTSALPAPNACSLASTFTGATPPSARCCTQIHGGAGMFFRATNDLFPQYLCSDLRGVFSRDDWRANWGFSSADELADFDAFGLGVFTWQHFNGAVRQTANVAVSMFVGNEEVNHGCVSTRVVGDATGEAGILFAYLATNDYYRFAVKPNQYRRVTRFAPDVNDRWTEDAPAPLPNNWTQQVELKVCFGDGIHTFVDGARVSYTGDPRFTLGSNTNRRIGLWNSYNPGVQYRNLASFPAVEGF